MECQARFTFLPCLGIPPSPRATIALLGLATMLLRGRGKVAAPFLVDLDLLLCVIHFHNGLHATGHLTTAKYGSIHQLLRVENCKVLSRQSE